MASYLGEVGRAAQSDSNVETTLPITVAGNYPVGTRLVAICGNLRGQAGNPKATGVTDTQGNVWQIAGGSDPNFSPTLGPFVGSGTFSTRLTTALGPGDVITVATPVTPFGASTAVTIIAFAVDAAGTRTNDIASGQVAPMSGNFGPSSGHIAHSDVIVAGTLAVSDITGSLSGPFTVLATQTINAPSFGAHTVEHYPFYAVLPAGTYLESVSGPGTGGTLPAWNGNATWWEFPVVAPVVGGVWNIHTELLQYQRASALGGHCFYQSVDSPVPPTTSSATVFLPTGGAVDGEPRMIRDWLARTWLVLTRLGGSAPGVYSTVSDDEGKTWATPIMAFTGGRHPDITFDPRTGEVFRAAYVSGQLKGLLTDASGATTPVFTLLNDSGIPLAPDDDVFHIIPAPEGPRRWLLVMTAGGNVVDFYSPDQGRTWKQIT